MIIYNTTVQVAAPIAEAWIRWLKEVHIPAIMKTGCFTNYKIVRLIEIDESEGPTYAIQYSAESKADYNRFITLHVQGFQERSREQWGDGYVSFSSVMQVVE
jgi:hypothetical protein